MSNNRVDKFHGNIAAWKNLADIQIDFFTQFVRAWIPFNAWFSTSYPGENTDREILTRVKLENNPFKDKIILLLTRSNPDSLNFVKQLGKLHSALFAIPIPSKERWITFTNITIEKNLLPYKEEWLQGKGYKFKISVTYNHSAPPGTQKIKVEVLDVLAGVNPGRMHWNQNEWDLDELLSNSQFKLKNIPKKELRERVQNIVKKCYSEINPLKPENLILDVKSRGKTSINKIKSNCLIADEETGVYFINEPEKIAKAIIEILYNLRNALFHGEITPSPDVQEIYKEAYHLLYPLIKALS